ncbi:hypothetical protein KCP73_23705 [Salmonella enterica subsp. enterica]|nr:hypothetical protein KCP73_23705 [Salmonella enterica subsp. enterica]
MWSAATNSSSFAGCRERRFATLLGINVLKVLSGLNPFGACHQKSKGQRQIEKAAAMNRRIYAFSCTVSALWRRTVP